MSAESRSRSRSPVAAEEIEDIDGSPRNKRHDKRKFDRPRTTGKRVPSDCRIYVSNIPYEFKWQDLKDLFRSEVGNVAYVEMFNDDSGRPRGSAIVDFETPDMAQKAIDKMHRMELKGRKLVVKERDEIVHSRDFMFLFNKDLERDRNSRFGKDLDRRRAPPFNRGGNSSFPDNGPPAAVNYGNTYGLSISFLESLGINGPLVNKVFVANLDYKVTEEDLREVFKVAGKVTNAEVVKDQDGKSRGFGVVEYEHPLQAVQSISMLHNQSYYDRKISVRLDRVAEKHQKEPPTKLPPGLKSLGLGLGSNGEAITDITSISASQSSNMNSGAMNPGVNPVAMGMGGGGGGGGGGVGGGGFNLPSNNNMRTGVNPSLPMMGLSGMDSMPLGGGSSMGMGMGGPNVMNMGGMNQGNMNPVLPNVGSFGNPGLGMNQGMNQGNGYNNNNNNTTNNGTSNFNNPSSSNSSYSNRNVCQISNLPLDYTWKNLKDLCSNYGDIRFAEIKKPGVGWVRFSMESEARRTAELLDRQRFDGRVLDACLV